MKEQGGGRGERQVITKGGGVLGRADRVEEAAVGGHRGGDLEDERARFVGSPRLPAPGRPERPSLQIRETHRRLPSHLLPPPQSTAATRRNKPRSGARAAEGGGGAE